MTRKAAFLAMLLLAPALSVAADDGRSTKFSLGYSLFSIHNSGGSLTFPLGLYADVSVPIAGKLAIEGNVKWHHHFADNQPYGASDVMGGVGPRLEFGAGHRNAPYVHLVAGFSHSSVGDVSHGTTSVMLGGGVDLKATGSGYVRLAADYRFLRYNGYNNHTIIFGVGYTFAKSK